MNFITDINGLSEIYGEASEGAIIKVAHKLTPKYREWIQACRFCVLSTVGPEGTDATPRGDNGPVVKMLDEVTLALPDWHGNNRMDSLRNILRDPRVSLMFMAHGSTNVVRVNGRAKVTTDDALRQTFAKSSGNMPRSVIIIAINEVYIHCSRALVRSALWEEQAEIVDLPSVGQIMKEMKSGAFDDAEYDRRWPKRMREMLW